MNERKSLREMMDKWIKWYRRRKKNLLGLDGWYEKEEHGRQ